MIGSRTLDRLLVVTALFAWACSSETSRDSGGTGSTPAIGAATGTAVSVEAQSCPSAELPPVFCADTDGMERAAVVDIIDGDTFDVILGGVEQRVRIFGVDTPERGDSCFFEATELLRTLTKDDVLLRADARKVDRNGRLLRYVYRTDGLSIDAVLIRAGVAYAWTRDGALRDELMALEDQAKRERSGCLWN